MLSSNSSLTELSKYRVLVVDDTTLFRQVFKRTLQVAFPMIGIDDAANGDEALQKVEALPPDLIFMDIRLPGENGLELTRKIKATHPNIRVLILTGYDTPEYREIAFQYGVDDFFSKTSLNPSKLKDLVSYYQGA